MPQHVGVHPGHADAGASGQVLEAAGGGVAVHSGAEGVAQNRAGVAAVDGSVDGSGHRGWQRDQDDLAAFAAFAAYAQDSVAVFLA
jgi:hypothetical protein